jgi:hypothetical protein
MSKWKLLLSLILGLAVVFNQSGIVNAAPPFQDGTFIAGTIQNIVAQTDADTGDQTVVVTLLVNGESQSLRLSVETAIGLFLIDENLVVDDSMIDTDVEIDLSTVIPDETPVEEKQHPVGAKIAEFFSGLIDVDYEMIMSSHSDGLGFGVITQALWMTQKLGGDDTLFQDILDAKLNNDDYSMITLPDGTFPQNWGQFKKAVLKGEDENSLGDVMSDKEENDDALENLGNRKPENLGNGYGKPENPGNGNGQPENPGNGNGNRNENGKPSTPPGQDKNKNKQNNGIGKP